MASMKTHRIYNLSEYFEEGHYTFQRGNNARHVLVQSCALLVQDEEISVGLVLTRQRDRVDVAHAGI